MNIASAIDRFTRQLAANGRSVHTQSAYRRDLGVLARWVVGKPDLGKITPDTLARFLTSDAVLLTPDGEPRSPISVNRTKSALRSFFGFCHDSGWIKENPARLIRSGRTNPKEPTTLTEDEIGKLRDYLKQQTGSLADRDRLIFELLIGTGMRLGSLVSLNTGDVDLSTQVVHIRTKGGGQERVFLNPTLGRLLSRHLRKLAPRGPIKPDTPLIQGQSGSRLGHRQVQLRFVKWCEEAGITRPVSVHSLRHTFATRLYHKTGDLHLVQRALGHRQITTTEIYAKVNDQILQRAIESTITEVEYIRPSI